MAPYSNTLLQFCKNGGGAAADPASRSEDDRATTPANSDPNAAPRIPHPIANDSISSDLLAAMMSKRLGGPFPLPRGRSVYGLPLELHPWSDTPEKGTRISDPNLFDMTYYIGVEPDRDDRSQWNEDFTLKPGGVFKYLSDTSSLYDVNMLQTTIRIKQPANTHVVENGPSALASLTNAAADTEILQLESNAQIRWAVHGKVIGNRWNHVMGDAQDLDLRASNSYSIRKGSRIPVNQVFHEWRAADDQFMQLLVMKPDGADEARLCLNIHVPGIKRLSCSRWTVATDWKLGQEPTYLGSHVVDDRSVKEGQSGLRHWANDPATANPTPEQPTLGMFLTRHPSSRIWASA